jgi:hypothetical protein
MTALKTYCVHGLSIETPISLDGLLQPAPAGSQACVLDPVPIALRRGSLPETWDHHSISKDGYLVGDGTVFMALVNGIRCLVEGGHSITIDPGPDDLEAAAYLYAMSAGVGSALRQRGYFPLHCAAIEAPAGCVAFPGNAGDGKSTLAASFSTRGFKLFTDDRLTIHERTDAPFLAAPSLPVLHLFEEGAEVGGLDGTELAVDSYRFGKHIHFAPARYTCGPRELKALYFTDWHDDPALDPAITTLNRMDAMMRTRRDVSLAHLVELMSHEHSFFGWASRLCSQVPAFSFRRPKDKSRHDECMDLIISHVRERFS